MEMNTINSISKPKLPKAYSYVLRSSQLHDVLISTGITIHTDLNYWLPQIIGSIFEVHYFSANQNVPYPRLYIRAGALTKDDIQNAKIFMANEVLPTFSIWLEEIHKQVCYSQYPISSSPYFNAIYKEHDCQIIQHL